MNGGDGQDYIIVDNLGDVVDAGSGHDTIESSVSWVLDEDEESRTLTGTAVNGTGNDLANVIIGNGFGNFLNGMGGADDIQGSDGTDFINGGAGNDTLAGGLGADTFIIDAFDGVDTITDFEANGPTQDEIGRAHV